MFRTKRAENKLNFNQSTIGWQRILIFAVTVGAVAFVQAMLVGNIRDPFGLVQGTLLSSMLLALLISMSFSMIVIAFMKYFIYRRRVPKSLAALARRLTAKYLNELQARQLDRRRGSYEHQS